MFRSMRSCPPLWIVAGLALGIVWWFVRTPSSDVVAAPYTVRSVNHPFDPDWPDVYMLMSTKCVGCHRPGSKRTDLTSYQGIVDAATRSGRPIVVPGKPELSLFFRKVAWNHTDAKKSHLPEHPSMPVDEAEWLTGNQQATIERWIRNGALEFKLPDQCAPRPLLEFDYPSAKECRVCHPKQYEEWSRSMHAYAQHSPIFEAFNLTLQERTSGTIGTFCTRCHTPLGTSMGEGGSRRNVNRSRLSMESVTCVVCHRVAKPYYKSNTRRAIMPGKLLDTCMYGPFQDSVSHSEKTHFALQSKAIKSAAFCGACHDVTSPSGIRLEEAFSEWQNSPAAKQGITCQQCHMGPVQGVAVPDDQRPLGRAATVPNLDPTRIPQRHLTDHTFAGPDYSLLPDTEFPHKLDWMYEVDYREYEKLTPHQKWTLNDLRRTNRRQLRIADQKRYELLRNAANITVRAPASASTGERIKVRVDVTNKVSGHNFPTGFTAERQAWVEIGVYDPSGRPVFLSGDLDREGDLRDEHSHAVESGAMTHDRYLLNFQSKFVALTNRGTERPVIIPVNRHFAPLNIIRPANAAAASFGRPFTFRVAKSSLPPLATAGRDYPVRLPKFPGEYSVRVRLNYRHIPPVLLDKIGIPHLKHLLEVVVIDEFEAVIRVTPNR